MLCIAVDILLRVVVTQVWLLRLPLYQPGGLRICLKLYSPDQRVSRLLLDWVLNVIIAQHRWIRLRCVVDGSVVHSSIVHGIIERISRWINHQMYTICLRAVENK